MTKKDFVLIAKVLAEHRSTSAPEVRFIVDCIAEKFADKLATTNVKFNRERFITATQGE